MTPRKVYNLGVDNLTFDKSSKRYRYRNPLNGKRFWFGKNRELAIERAHKANMAVALKSQLHDEAAAGIYSVDFVISEFIDREFVEYAWDASTRTNHLAAYHLYQNEFGHRLIKNVRRAELDDWIRKRCSTYGCRKKHRMRLIRLWAFAVGREWVDINEPQLIQKYKSSLKILANRRKRKRLSVDEFWRIHEVAPLFLQVAMQLSLLTLQSRQECCNMRRSDIRDGYLYVIRRKTAGESDAAFIRIKITPDISTVLSESHTSDIASPFIVHHRPRLLPAKRNQKKPHWTYVMPQRLSIAFKAARDKCGVSDSYVEGEAPTFHEIRSLGSRLYLAEGFSKDYIQALMTHTDEKTTEIYLANPDALENKHFKSVEAGLTMPNKGGTKTP